MYSQRIREQETVALHVNQEVTIFVGHDKLLKMTEEITRSAVAEVYSVSDYGILKLLKPVNKTKEVAALQTLIRAQALKGRRPYCFPKDYFSLLLLLGPKP